MAFKYKIKYLPPIHTHTHSYIRENHLKRKKEKLDQLCTHTHLQSQFFAPFLLHIVCIVNNNEVPQDWRNNWHTHRWLVPYYSLVLLMNSVGFSNCRFRNAIIIIIISLFSFTRMYWMWHTSVKQFKSLPGLHRSALKQTVDPIQTLLTPSLSLYVSRSMISCRTLVFKCFISICQFGLNFDDGLSFESHTHNMWTDRQLEL